MPKTDVTVEELIATLAHSNVPTLITEGKDDIIVLRKMEDKFSDRGLSVLPVGGRNKVIELFDRRGEIVNSNLILFAMDQDTWLYEGVPAQYQHASVIFTEGYSIENDMYRDGSWEGLFYGNERILFEDELNKFIRWYAITLARHLSGKNVVITRSPTHILDGIADLDDFISLQKDEAYPEELRKRILDNYARELRGKSLLALILRRLSAHNRDPKHSGKSLLEHGCAANGYYFTRFSEWIALNLNSNGLPSDLS
jgi:hypothetical protein